MMARHGSLSVRLRDQRVAKSVWWARRLLLGYGEQVRALEPVELVAAMRESVWAMSRLYEEEKY
jgi:predicted DNA-binding transcriptional regulator YafY